MKTECNCRNQSGLCSHCSMAELAAMESAAADARRLKVMLATKRVSARVRSYWKGQLALAERRAA